MNKAGVKKSPSTKNHSVKTKKATSGLSFHERKEFARILRKDGYNFVADMLEK